MASIVAIKLLMDQVLNHHCIIHTDAACSVEYSDIRIIQNATWLRIGVY